MKNTSKVSYDALQIEGLKDVLAQVSSACDELGIHFFIVGAIARNIWFAAHDERPAGTRDIDFAVYIPGKEEYLKLKEDLQSKYNYHNSSENAYCMLTPDGKPIDLLPFGEIELPSFMNCTTTEAYEEWLIQNQQTQLYLDILQDEDSLLQPNALILLLLVGRQDWEKFLFYLRQFKLGVKEIKPVIDHMSGDGQWTTQQLEDIYQLVSLTEFDLILLLRYAFRANLFDSYKFFYSKRKEPFPLQNLITAIKECLEKKDSPEAHKFIHFYLQEIEKHYGTFCDYPLILTLAGPEKDQELLISVLKLLPEEKRHSNTLLNIGLTFENEYILQTFASGFPAIEKAREEEIALIEDKKEDLVTLIKKATLEGNYFQVEFLASQLAPKHLEAPMLEAARRGMVGIVKVLVEQGNVAPDCCLNEPVKFANKSGFLKLKQYLLSKGVKDEEFEQEESSFFFGQHDHLDFTTLT